MDRDLARPTVVVVPPRDDEETGSGAANRRSWKEERSRPPMDTHPEEDEDAMHAQMYDAYYEDGTPGQEGASRIERSTARDREQAPLAPWTSKATLRL